MSRIVKFAAAVLVPWACAGPSGAQTWSRTYAGPAAEAVLALGEDGPGQLRVAAWTDSFGTATGDAWYLALSNDGPVVFETLAGETDPGGADAAAFARDGGALFAGRNVVDIFTKQDGWVLRVDDAGELQWGTLIAWVGLGRVALTAAAEPPSGGWFVMGTSAMNDFPPQNTLLVRMDDLGAVLWRREHGSGAADTPRSIAVTDDGGLIMAGTTTSGGDEDALVVKFDFSGDIEWQRQYGGDGADEANDVVVLSSGGYAACGTTQSFTASGRAPWLQRFDDAGTISWQVVFGDQEWGDLQALVETSDGNLVALGRISEPGFPTNDLWAVKVDASDGRVLWQRAYEGESGDFADDLIELLDGSLLLGGTWAWGFPEEALWVMRADSEGRLPGCDFVRDTALATSSPRLTEATGTLTDQVARPETLPQAFTVETAGATVTDNCPAAGCPRLSCDAIVVAPDPACEGEELMLTAQVSGGEGALEVLWDVLPDPAIDATGNPASLLLPPDTHEIAAIVSDSCADPEPQTCTMTTTVTVHPDQTPVVSPDGPTSFCAASGESVTLDAGAGHASYQWRLDGVELPGETAQTVLADATGEWSVRVVDSNGCTWTSAPVAVNAEDCAGCAAFDCGAILVAPNPACAGETQAFDSTATGEGTISHEWDFDGDGLTDATGSPASWAYPPGDWTVRLTVRDSCDDPSPRLCELFAPVTVHPDRTPVITPDGPTEFCAASGESLSLDAGAGYASYEWLVDGVPVPMSDQQVLPAPASGSYRVRVVDENGCEWTSAPVVVVADSCECTQPLECRELRVEPPRVCEGESQRFTLAFGGGEGPYTVEWDFDEDGAADATGNPVDWQLPAGTTRVAATVFDTGCPPFPGVPRCTLELDVSVSPAPLVTITAGGPTSFCANDGESVTLSGDPGFASYQWTRNGLDLPGATDPQLLVTASGTYALRVIDANGCAATAAAVVVDAAACAAACPPLTCDAVVLTPGPPCAERLYTLEAISTGGEGALTIEWDLDQDGVADAFGSPLEAELPAGPQVVAVTVSDSCADPGPQSCMLSEPVDVPTDAPPPGELSDVRAGEPPLLLLDGGATLRLEEDAAAAVNLHVGAIGSWYAPRPAGASACHREDAVSNGDGTVSLAVDLPAGAWVVASASGECFEGPAGADSFGADRGLAADWEPCGPR